VKFTLFLIYFLEKYVHKHPLIQFNHSNIEE
jgi:hypothetical protein